MKNKITPLAFRNDITDHFFIIFSIEKYELFFTQINQPRFFGDKSKVDCEEFFNDFHLNLYNCYKNLHALSMINFNNFAKLTLIIINKHASFKQAFRLPNRLPSKP